MNATQATEATLNPSAWSAYGVTLNSRLLLGTAGYPSPQALHEAIVASGTEVSIKVGDFGDEPESRAILDDVLRRLGL